MTYCLIDCTLPLLLLKIDFARFGNWNVKQKQKQKTKTISTPWSQWEKPYPKASQWRASQPCIWTTTLSTLPFLWIPVDTKRIRFLLLLHRRHDRTMAHSLPLLPRPTSPPSSPATQRVPRRQHLAEPQCGDGAVRFHRRR